jgi:single-strand DNA-binding protein
MSNWQGNQGGNWNNGGNGGNGGNNNGSSSYYGHAEIEIIGNLATIKDPDSGERVHAYTKMMNGGAKVANANIAVNHYGKDEADFWKLEVWAQTPDRASMHNFLMDHCYKGRMVFVKGVPILQKDSNGTIWPTIRVTKLIGMPDGNGNNNGGNSGGNSRGNGNGSNPGNYQNNQQGGWNNQPQGGWGGAGPQQGGQPPQGSWGAPQGNNGWGNQQQYQQQQNGFGAGPQQGVPFGGPQVPQGVPGGPQSGPFGAPSFQGPPR